MKIYFAGDFSVACLKGREKELSSKYDPWNRVFSFYWMDAIKQSTILELIRRSKNESTEISGSLGNSKTGVVE